MNSRAITKATSRGQRPTPVPPAIKLRLVIRLRTTPFGKKLPLARRLAGECGRSLRTVLSWQTAYKQLGYRGLDHRRADCGLCRLYGDAELPRVVEAAVRVRHYGDLRREWRSLALPGSYETFRYWVRKIQVFGYSEASDKWRLLSA